MRRHAAVIGQVICAALIFLACKAPRTPDFGHAREAFANISATVLPAVVRVRPFGEMAQHNGAGFFVRMGDEKVCLVVTNSHVVSGAKAITVDTQDDEVLQADWIGSDPEVDIAVLRLRDKFDCPHSLSFEDDAPPRPGDWVLSFGSAAGILNTVSVGVLAARGRVPNPTLAAQGFVDYLFIDTSAAQGTSGGPVLNLDGHVVGINCASIGTGPLGVAIPSRLARAALVALKRDGRSRHSSIGIKLRREASGTGRELFHVIDCSSACIRSGLMINDRIVLLNGSKVLSIKDFEWTVFMTSPGEYLRLEIERDGQRLEINTQAGVLTQSDFARRKLNPE